MSWIAWAARHWNGTHFQQRRPEKLMVRSAISMFVVAAIGFCVGDAQCMMAGEVDPQVTAFIKDLPVLLAGGRFQHGQHLAFAPGTVPLCNVFVSVLNQLGFDDKSFATSTGTLKGLELT